MFDACQLLTRKKQKENVVKKLKDGVAKKLKEEAKNYKYSSIE